MAFAAPEDTKIIVSQAKKERKNICGFRSLHMERRTARNDRTSSVHHTEERRSTRTHLNRRLIGYPDGVKDRPAAVQEKIEEAG